MTDIRIGCFSTSVSRAHDSVQQWHRACQRNGASNCWYGWCRANVQVVRRPDVSWLTLGRRYVPLHFYTIYGRNVFNWHYEAGSICLFSKRILCNNTLWNSCKSLLCTCSYWYHRVLGTPHIPSIQGAAHVTSVETEMLECGIRLLKQQRQVDSLDKLLFVGLMLCWAAAVQSSQHVRASERYHHCIPYSCEI